MPRSRLAMCSDENLPPDVRRSLEQLEQQLRVTVEILDRMLDAIEVESGPS